MKRKTPLSSKIRPLIFMLLRHGTFIKLLGVSKPARDAQPVAVPALETGLSPVIWLSIGWAINTITVVLLF